MPHDTRIPEGIRNNNPGNIRASAHVAWLGQTGTDSQGFCIFEAPYFGLRAMYKTLITYHVEHKCMTVRNYIDRYAPPSENDTQAYVQGVCKRLVITPEHLVNVPGGLTALMKAMIIQENGRCPYDDETFRRVEMCYPLTN